jgi:hypothetical protein
MFKPFDTVRLRRNRADLGLSAGRLGAVVLIHEGDVYEVEFVGENGHTVSMVALRGDEIEKPADAARAPASGGSVRRSG